MRSSNNVINFPPPGNLDIDTGVQKWFNTNDPAPNKVSSMADDIGQTIVMVAKISAPFMEIWRFSHSTKQWDLLSLSNFPVLSSEPSFYCLGFDAENSRYYFSIEGTGGGSWSVGAYDYFTISGSVATYVVGTTPPAVASHAQSDRGCCHNGKIVVPYHETTTFLMSECRVYDISLNSWAAPVGTNPNPDDALTGVRITANDSDEAIMTQGGQSDKGYLTCIFNAQSNFLEFDFSVESWNDKTGVFPLLPDSGAQTKTNMVCDPSGKYIVGVYENEIGLDQTIFVYDRLNDSLVFSHKGEGGTAFPVLPGDESNNSLGWIGAVVAGAVTIFPILYKNYTGGGYLTGLEAPGVQVNGVANGAQGCYFAYKLNGSDWIHRPDAMSLWALGGFDRMMKRFNTSLEYIFFCPYGMGLTWDYNGGAVVYSTED